MEEHTIFADEIIEEKTCVWVENGELIVSIFTEDNKNHVFEINLGRRVYYSYIDQL